MVEVEFALQEEDAEEADEEDKGATRHLVDACRYVEEADVHERRGGYVAACW